MSGVDMLNALAAFRAVARTGSFTAAAERLGAPQPVVSRRVAALERELAVPLFERSTRTVTLTDLGAQLLPRAERALDQITALRRVAAEAGHQLALALPPGVDPRALAAIRRSLGAVAFTHDPPAERARQWAHGLVAGALLTAEESQADIRLELGVAGVELAGDLFWLRTLRRARNDRAERPRVLHVGIEDEVSAVTDPLRRAAWGAGLRHDQLEYGAPPQEVAVRAHDRGDLVLTTAHDASHLDLDWCRLGDVVLSRGLSLVARPELCSTDQRERLIGRLRRGMTR